jgi:hypothetical protein
MKNYLLLITILSGNCFGQSYFYNNRYYENLLLIEAGVSVGGMNCLTDLGGNTGRGKPFFKDINWNCTRAFAGINVGFLYRYTIGARLEAGFGKVTGADSLLQGNVSEAIYRYQRNLHFRSNIKEILLIAEFHPLSLYQPGARISPYLLAGIGLFSFNPKARYQDKWVALQPLRTEGQLYARTQFNFPAGCGMKYELSALLNARLEIVYRFLQTDYLDDVSTAYIDPALFHRYFDAATATLAARVADQRLPGTTRSAKRGNPGNRDGYYSINLKISMILNRKRV